MRSFLQVCRSFVIQYGRVRVFPWLNISRIWANKLSKKIKCTLCSILFDFYNLFFNYYNRKISKLLKNQIQWTWFVCYIANRGIGIYYFILYIIDNALFRSSDRTVGGPGTKLEPGTSGLEAGTLTSDNSNIFTFLRWGILHRRYMLKKLYTIQYTYERVYVHNHTVTAVHMWHSPFRTVSACSVTS